MTPTAGLRALVLLLLALALALPSFWRDRGQAARAVWLDGARDVRRFRDSLLVGQAPPVIVRRSVEPPDAAELELLAGAARRAPLVAALPPRVGLVVAQPPSRPRSGRA